MQQDAVWNTLAVLVALLGVVVLFGVVAGPVLRRLQAWQASRDVYRADEPPAPPPGPRGFAVIADDPPPAVPAQPVGTGPGRYRVSGVVAATRVDVTMRLDADSPANAKVKAELSGVVVTDVAKEA